MSGKTTFPCAVGGKNVSFGFARINEILHRKWRKMI